MSRVRKRIARLLRRCADALDSTPTKVYLSGVYWDGRTFILTTPAVTLTAKGHGLDHDPRADAQN